MMKIVIYTQRSKKVLEALDDEKSDLHAKKQVR
jgi:hypothetical protein